MKQQFTKNPGKNQQSGISVIEVLIVVAILLLLMVALYRTIGRDVDKSRDASRKKDLKEIKIAFEDYYNDNDSYPPEDSLKTCGSSALSPYLKQVPCDKLGQPYLYLPEFDDDGRPSVGYRVLAKLTILNDPMIEQVGCPWGCGDIPAGVKNPEKYNYGISEGVPLNRIFNPPEELPVDNCSIDKPCFCCNNPGSQCNVYEGPNGTCNGVAYASNEDCVVATGCIE